MEETWNSSVERLCTAIEEGSRTDSVSSDVNNSEFVKGDLAKTQPGIMPSRARIVSMQILSAILGRILFLLVSISCGLLGEWRCLAEAYMQMKKAARPERRMLLVVVAPAIFLIVLAKVTVYSSSWLVQTCDVCIAYSLAWGCKRSWESMLTMELHLPFCRWLTCAGVYLLLLYTDCDCFVACVSAGVVVVFPKRWLWWGAGAGDEGAGATVEEIQIQEAILQSFASGRNTGHETEVTGEEVLALLNVARQTHPERIAEYVSSDDQQLEALHAASLDFHALSSILSGFSCFFIDFLWIFVVFYIFSLYLHAFL